MTAQVAAVAALISEEGLRGRKGQSQFAAYHHHAPSRGMPPASPSGWTHERRSAQPRSPHHHLGTTTSPLSFVRLLEAEV
jgi:hypothetical protein